MLKIIGATEVPVEKKPYLSPTQLDMYTKCGEMYRRRYIEHEKIAPGIAAIKGNAVHRGAEHNWKQKIDTHEDLPAVELQEIAADAFENGTKGSFALTPEEAGRGAGVVLGEAKDSAVRLTKLFSDSVAPRYQPLIVEEKVRIELPNSPFDLEGRLDMVDIEDRIQDLKTTGKKKQQSEADASVQLTFYAAGYQVKTGRPAKEVILDVLVEKKTPEHQIITSTRDADDFQAFVNRINAVAGGIAAQIFTPAMPGSWWCGPKWCGFYNTCPYVNNKRTSVTLDT